MSNEDEVVGLSADEQLRRRAVRRLRVRAGFWSHLLMFLTVNTVIVVIWAVTSGGFFWPVFPIVGWGIGLVMNAWDVWHPAEFDEDQIHREMSRIQRKP